MVGLRAERKRRVASSRPSVRLRDWSWPPLYFLGLALLHFHPVLLGRSSNVVPAMQERLWPWRTHAPRSELGLQLDGAISSYPWSVAMHDAISARAFPFWDWNSFSGGYDLASDGVSGVMYPLHWFVWAFFEPPLAHDLFMLGHVWLGGLAMFALLRHWGIGAPASLVGGTAWALAPFNTGWMQAEMITPVLLCVPLSFLTTSMALRSPSAVRVVAASASLALTLVAGNLVVFLVVVWVVGLYGVAVVCARGIRTRSGPVALRTGGVLAAVAIGAGVLSAFSLVPTLLNLTSLGRRTATLDESLPPQGSISAIWSALWSAPSVQDPVMLFALNWCGRAVLVLALVGLLHRGALRWGALTLSLVFTLLPSLPLLVTIAWYVVPPLRAVSGFGRLTFLATFGTIVLAALGMQVALDLVDRLLRSRPAQVRRVVSSSLTVAVLVIVVAELLGFMRSINPDFVDRSPSRFYPATASHRAVLEADEPGRWPNLLLPLSVPSTDPDEPWDGASFWGTTALVHGIDSVGGYDSAVPRRAASITRVMQGVPVPEAVRPFNTAFLPTFDVTWARLDLAAKLGVTHVYLPPGTSVEDSAYAGLVSSGRVTSTASGTVVPLRRPHRQPRLVTDARVVDTPEQALEAFAAPDHDPGTSVVLEAHRGEPVSQVAPAPSAGGSVLTSTRGSNHARVTFRANSPAWLVVPIGFDDGWSAELDGEALETRPADYAFTAVRVPEGRHTVTFSYRPEGFTAGSVASLTGMVAALLLIVRSVVVRRRGSRSRAAGDD